MGQSVMNWLQEQVSNPLGIFFNLCSVALEMVQGELRWVPTSWQMMGKEGGCGDVGISQLS